MTAALAQIYRHPIKGHGREALSSVHLTPGACLPWDRHWAVAHEAAQLGPGWNRCSNFARGAKAPALMAMTSTLDEATGTVMLHHPDIGSFAFCPDDPAMAAPFLDWVMPLAPPDRALPTQIFSADVGLTDSEFPSVSILSLASLRDLSGRVGQDLSVHRWRGNLWLDGAEPFAEFGWIGKHLTIGDAVLRIEERITRCTATAVDPMTGHRDIDTLAHLQAAHGHQDFGVYGVVVRGGTIAAGMHWSVA